MTSAPPKIRDLPGARTPADMAMVLASLPKEPLLSMISAQSVKQEAPWLRAFAQGGMFDFTEEMKNLGAVSDMNEICEDFADQTQAFTAFMRTVTLSIQEETAASIPLKRSMEIASFEANDDLKKLLAEQAPQIVAQYEAFCQNDQFGQYARRNVELHAAMAMWMVAACLVNEPTALKTLVEGSPKSLYNTVGLETLGPAFARFCVSGDAKMNLTPACAALQLSRIECLKVIGDFDQAALEHMGDYKAEGRDNDFDAIDLVGVLDKECLRLTCWPAALSHVLQSTMNTDAKMAEFIYPCAHKAMMPNTTAWLQCYQSAFLEAGIYAHEPETSLRVACVQGNVEVVSSLRSVVDWDKAFALDMFKGARSIILGALNHAGVPAEKARAIEAAALTLRMAREEGNGQTVIGLFAQEKNFFSKNSGGMEPIETILKKDALPILMEYIAQGLDPNKALQEGGLTPLQIADGIENSVCANAMRAWTARALTRNLMDEITLAQSQPRP